MLWAAVPVTLLSVGRRDRARGRTMITNFLSEGERVRVTNVLYAGKGYNNPVHAREPLLSRSAWHGPGLRFGLGVDVEL